MSTEINNKKQLTNLKGNMIDELKLFAYMNTYEMINIFNQCINRNTKLHKKIFPLSQTLSKFLLHVSKSLSVPLMYGLGRLNMVSCTLGNEAAPR